MEMNPVENAPREDVEVLRAASRREGKRLIFAGVCLGGLILILGAVLWFRSGKSDQVFTDLYVDANGNEFNFAQEGDYFEVTSPAMSLGYAETHCKDIVNASGFNTFELPSDIVEKFKGRDMLITGYQANFVGDDGKVLSVNDCYNHHYVVGINSVETCDYKPKSKEQLVQKPHLRKVVQDTIMTERRLDAAGEQVFTATSFSEANGAEWRRSIHGFPTSGNIGQKIRSPGCVQFFGHAINTKIPDGVDRKDAFPKKNAAPAEKLYNGILECPCTDRRVIDGKKNTIDGMEVSIHCRNTSALEFQENPACSVATYEGGEHCCMDSMILLDKDQTNPAFAKKTNIHYKYRFYYREAKPTDYNAYRAFMNTGNEEWDVPKCEPEKDPSECIHVQERTL